MTADQKEVLQNAAWRSRIASEAIEKLMSREGDGTRYTNAERWLEDALRMLRDNKSLFIG